jgi:hypothetical protein
MRLVCSAEPRFVDSTTITASQMADGNQTLRMRVVDGFTRQAILANHSWFSREAPCRPAYRSVEVSKNRRVHLPPLCAVKLEVLEVPQPRKANWRIYQQLLTFIQVCCTGAGSHLRARKSI